MHHWQKRKQTT